MRNKPRFIVYGQVRNIFDIIFGMGYTSGINTVRFFFDQVVENRNIMRRQIPKNINVGLKKTKIDTS